MPSKLQYANYPCTPKVQAWEEQRLMIDLRVGLKELLGVPMNLISEEFVNKLDNFVSQFRDRPYLLTPGARLLQGAMLVDGPFSEMAHMAGRIRGLCVFITALEHMGRELEGATKDENLSTDRTSRSGKDHNTKSTSTVDVSVSVKPCENDYRKSDKVVSQDSTSRKGAS